MSIFQLFFFYGKEGNVFHEDSIDNLGILKNNIYIYIYQFLSDLSFILFIFFQSLLLMN